MDLSFLRRKPPIMVGLDISSGLVKLLELSSNGQTYRVESYASEVLAPDAMQEKEIKDIEAVGEAVSKVVKRSHTDLKYAAVAVAGSTVITKIIQMNAGLTDAEMLMQIQLEAERYIPYPLQDINLDFQIIGPSQRSPELVDVLLAASRKEIIDKLLEVLSIGELKAKVIDVEAYVMQRAFTLIADQIPNKGENQTVGIIDIGSTTTTFSVLHDGLTVYTREQIFGGKQLTEEIQRRYGLSYEEANIAKKQGGLPEGYVVEVLEPFEDAVVQQIGRSMQFFFSSSSQFTELNQLVLAGGCASISGLARKVEEKLSIPAIVANPFVNMSINPRVSMPVIQADAPSLMICCGLALRSFVS